MCFCRWARFRSWFQHLSSPLLFPSWLQELTVVVAALNSLFLHLFWNIDVITTTVKFAKSTNSFSYLRYYAICKLSCCCSVFMRSQTCLTCSWHFYKTCSVIQMFVSLIFTSTVNHLMCLLYFNKFHNPFLLFMPWRSKVVEH